MSPPSIRPQGEGLLLRITARPGAARPGVQGLVGDALKVGVHAAPERGKANRELIEVLAQALGLRRSQVELVAGDTAREKTVRIEGLTEPELRRRLELLLGGD